VAVDEEEGGGEERKAQGCQIAPHEAGKHYGCSLWQVLDADESRLIYSYLQQVLNS